MLTCPERQAGPASEPSLTAACRLCSRGQLMFTKHPLGAKHREVDGDSLKSHELAHARSHLKSWASIPQPAVSVSPS